MFIYLFICVCVRCLGKTLWTNNQDQVLTEEEGFHILTFQKGSQDHPTAAGYKLSG